MDPAEEQQVVRGRLAEREPPLSMPWWIVAAYSRRVPVGVADRDVVAARVVSLEHRHDALGREPVDRGHDRRLDERAVRERQEVEVVVDQVELVGPLEHRRDVQAFPDLGVEPGVLGVAGRCGADEARRSQRVSRREQGDVDPPGHEALRQQRDELLPRPVVARRHAPRDRRKHRDADRGPRTAEHGRHAPKGIRSRTPRNLRPAWPGCGGSALLLLRPEDLPPACRGPAGRAGRSAHRAFLKMRAPDAPMPAAVGKPATSVRTCCSRRPGWASPRCRSGACSDDDLRAALGVGDEELPLYVVPVGHSAAEK